MPLEGSLIREHTSFDFVSNLQGILDISFRTIGHMVFVPDGESDSYMVAPDSQMGVAHKTFSASEIDDILESGTFAYKQAKAAYRYNLTEGLIIFPYQLPPTPDETDINDGFEAFLDYIETHVGIGWPYLQFTNLGNVDKAVLDRNIFLSEASSFIASEEALICLRTPRTVYGGSVDQQTMVDESVTIAESLNSKRTILAVHDGDDADLDGEPDSEAEFDALIMGLIASFPVAGWEITYKPVEGLKKASFTSSQRVTLENGWPGVPGGITAADLFQDPAFSANNTTGGTFIDVQQVIDYLRFRWRQGYALRQRNQNKIPYSFLGGQDIEAILEGIVLAEVEDPVTRVGIVRQRRDGTPDYDITSPRIADIPAADRANRIWKTVRQRIGYTASIIDLESDIALEV